jgi:flagellar basal-body rod protein FlgC
MDFLKSIAIAASGLRAQAGRMRVLAENLANADSTGQSGSDPFRRKISIPLRDRSRARRADGRARAGAHRPSQFRLKHEPGHPSADANGHVKYPNVNPVIEMADMREAQRSYEANINVIGATRRMIQRTLDILKA